MLTLLVPGLLVFGLGCSGKEEEEVGVTPREFSDCDPISYEYCSVPFPSSFYLREDSTSPTGYRVHLGETTIPKTDQGDISFQPSPAFWNERDGFSPLAPFLVEFPSMVLDGVPGHDNIGDSLTDSSPIVVVDAATGERLPVWAELDMSDPLASKRMLLIYPAVPMINGHRYVVGIRNLKDTSGAVIPPSTGFAALRDGTETQNWDIEGRRDLYADIFQILSDAGVAQSELQMAWDTVIASAEGIAGKAEFMRDDALSRVGAAGPAYVIDSISDEHNENIYREIVGHFTAPLYTETDGPGTLLTRDENGMPYYNGDTEVEFRILIPRTAVEDPRPLPLVQYGHGLLGDHNEVGSGYLGEMANKYGFVLFASDWTGMKSEDSDAIIQMILTEIDQFAMIPERSQQGFTEFFCAAAMMKGAMAEDESVKFPNAQGTPVSVIDPTTMYYYGNSQGGILGGAYMALQPDITRGVLGVPGMPYALLLYRSADFAPFFAVFKSVYDDSRDVALWMDLMQLLWDSGEAGGFGRQMNVEPLAGLPAHDILVQDAIGDAQVTTLGAQNMGRAYSGALIESPAREVWGLETVASGHTGSAIVEFEFGVTPVPETNVPPTSGEDTHEDTRREPMGQDQLWNFLTTGTVVNYCEGACDPG